MVTTYDYYYYYVYTYVARILVAEPERKAVVEQHALAQVVRF